MKQLITVTVRVKVGNTTDRQSGKRGPCCSILNLLLGSKFGTTDWAKTTQVSHLPIFPSRTDLDRARLVVLQKVVLLLVVYTSSPVWRICCVLLYRRYHHVKIPEYHCSYPYYYSARRKSWQWICIDVVVAMKNYSKPHVKIPPHKRQPVCVG